METKKADLMREILHVRTEYREALTDERRESAKRYHDDLMREYRELLSE